MRYLALRVPGALGLCKNAVDLGTARMLVRFGQESRHYANR